MTKEVEKRLSKYYDSDYTELYQCYARPSEAKKEAFNRCKKRMKELGGKDLRITGFNCDFFTAAFVYIDNDGKFSLCTITKSHTYYDKIER